MLNLNEQDYLKKLDWQKFYAFLADQQLLAKPALFKAYLYARGYQDFKFFMQTFFPDFCEFEFSRMHEDFFQDESNPELRGRREAIAAPRSHAKTTIKMLVKAVHAIVYGYEPFIVIIGYRKDHAEDKVQEILDQLGHPRLIAVFGDLLSTSGKKGGKRGFITTTGIRVMARSRGQEVRGISHGHHRPTLIICDDVENLEECQSPEMRAKVRDWFFKSVMKLGQINGTTNILFIGTCLHAESLLNDLLVNPGWKGRKYQAIEQFSERTDLWEQWKSLFNDLANPQRLSAADAFYKTHEVELLQGTQVLWPAGDSYEKLMKQLVSEGQAAFYSEKQNDPYDPERQLFKMEQAKRFELEYEGHNPKAIHWLDGSGKVIPWHTMQNVIAFHDPALGEKPGSKGGSDFAAIVVVAQDGDGYLYVLDSFLEKAAPSVQIQAAFQLHRQWQLDGLYLETNNFQYLLKDQYQRAQEHLPPKELLRVIGMDQHANKIERISSTLEPLITNGHLLFSNNLSKRLLQQLILFPTGHDDGPDALQGAVSQLKKRNPHTMDPAWANANLLATGNEWERLTEELEQSQAPEPQSGPLRRKPNAPKYPAPVCTGNDNGFGHYPG